jgi:hypothetical protein
MLKFVMGRWLAFVLHIQEILGLVLGVVCGCPDVSISSVPPSKSRGVTLKYGMKTFKRQYTFDKMCNSVG